MEFGVFDHLDKNDRPLARYYAERLEVIAAYERAGFYAYHVAEHHLTDLGMAPSPSVFLAAVAARTTRLRFGPMIFAAPLYHPLRLLHVIGLDTVPELVPCFDNYRKAWRETRGDAPLPKIGIGRFVFVADGTTEALRVARRAYAKWHASFVYLSQLMGWKHRHPRPAEFDAIAADGRAVAGTPKAVAEYVQNQMGESGANYFVGQFAFGDLTQEETLRS